MKHIQLPLGTVSEIPDLISPGARYINRNLFRDGPVWTLVRVRRRFPIPFVLETQLEDLCVE